MAVMAREEWTDGRLDDLKKGVDNGFVEMREEFRAFRGEMREMRAEIAATNRHIHQLTYGLIGTMFIGLLGIIATILTQT
jgi:hypothetical protein